MPKFTRLLLLLLCGCFASIANAADAVPGEEFCDRPVSSIVFEGNRVTRRGTLLREIDQDIDADCSLDAIVDSIQQISALGIFKNVSADLSLVEQALQLRFTVNEKFYYLAVPRLSRTSDAELRGGIELKFENFLGRLHQMEIVSERRAEDDGQGPGGYVHRLGYDIPRFFNSNYGMKLNLASDLRKVGLTRNRIDLGLAQVETHGIRLVSSRWLGQSRGVQGIRTIMGASISNRSINVLDGQAGPYRGGTNVSLIFGLEKRQINEGSFRRIGTVIGTTVTLGNKRFGSDFDYTQAEVYARAYIPLSKGIRNLNLKLRLGASDGAPFGEHSFSLGGGENMRGMKAGTFTGDLLALVNVEYLQAWFDYPQWRWVVFSDIGNVYQHENKSSTAIRARGGIGLRRKLLSLSNTDLRLDLAWDPDRNSVKTYVSSSLTF